MYVDINKQELKKRMALKGYNIKEFAQACGLNVGTISLLLNKEKRKVTPKTLLIFAEVLGVDAETLIQ